MPATMAKALAASALAVALLAGVLAAACASTPARRRAGANHPAAAAPSTPPLPPAEKLPPGVSLATQAELLPLGPFRITALYCGKFTPAQRRQFGTTARGGFVYRYTNISQKLTGSPALPVNFLQGRELAGGNVPGDQAAIGPGLSAEGEVDAVGMSGQPVTFDRCQLMGYQVMPAHGAPIGNYRPVAP